MFERPILIYSDHCKFSSKFLELLMSNTELFQSFIRINIDIDPQTKSRPVVFYEIQQILNFKITEVPTIIVDNAHYILAGEDAFNWLNDILTPKTPMEKEPNAFNPNEMVGFSDQYASYGVNDMHENTAEQSFLFINKQYDEIYTPPEDGSDVSPNEFAKKQKERETFANINYKNTAPPNNFNSMKQFNNNQKVSQKQKDIDSKYQQLLQEREKLNMAVSRV